MRNEFIIGSVRATFGRTAVSVNSVIIGLTTQ